MAPDASRSSTPGVDLALGALGALFGLDLVFWAAGWCSAVLAGHRGPHGHLLAGLTAFAHFGDPSTAWGSPVGPVVLYWMVHPESQRYNCFGCGSHGDAIQLVADIEGLSFAEAVRALDSGRPLRPAMTPRPSLSSCTPAAVARSEPPEIARTPARRVHAANAEAWRYWSLPKLGDRAADYLAGRGIEVGPLEAECGHPLVGHTPWSDTGLVAHLTRKGFTAEEVVDAGLALRFANGRMLDRFRHRVMLAARDSRGRVIGFYGRDTSAKPGASVPQYLNSPTTVVFDKSRALYRPTNGPIGACATLVVCEGTLDALAIAATAAQVGRSGLFASVSPSGTSLSTAHTARILALHPRVPTLCGDGDGAGREATRRWVTETIGRFGREVCVTILPAGSDPADWLANHGPAGLLAFTRKGWPAPGDPQLRPLHAGRYLADQAVHPVRGGPTEPLPVIVRRLGALGSTLPTGAAQQRFAEQAGAGIAAAGLAPDAWATRQISRAMAVNDEAAALRAIGTGEVHEASTCNRPEMW